jgi:hypothetical protein
VRAFHIRAQGMVALAATLLEIGGDLTAAIRLI